MPNVSGGLVTSDIEQRTDWNYEYNAKLAQTAENNGFEYALSSLALLLATQKLTADHLSNGRFAVNVVSGWFKYEVSAPLCNRPATQR